ncbi:hypothetical protein LCGC14_2990140 [marine sediment metagenome]|uniref:Uncharacterized protein n=1 Tax=marine sediment metagenome TaxID=412755 RepID=A0A0F8ZBN4_9ZZZZ
MADGNILTNLEVQNLMDIARLNSTTLCRFRGCQKLGRWFLRRFVKGGGVQEGRYCDECEDRFGEQNLRRFAKLVGKRVQTLTDAEGEFRGVQL